MILGPFGFGLAVLEIENVKRLAQSGRPVDIALPLLEPLTTPGCPVLILDAAGFGILQSLCKLLFPLYVSLILLYQESLAHRFRICSFEGKRLVMVS